MELPIIMHTCNKLKIIRLIRQTSSTQAPVLVYHVTSEDNAVGKLLVGLRIGILKEKVRGVTKLHRCCKMYLAKSRSPHKYEDIHGSLEKRLGQAKDGHLGI